MNLRILLITGIIAGLLAGNARAAAAVKPTSADRKAIQIIQTSALLFPNNLLRMGIQEGKVRIAINVSAEGKLVDAMVLAYTMEPFAKAAMTALKQWEFIPTHINGEPASSISEINFEFEGGKAQILNLDATESMQRMFFWWEGKDYAYRMYTLQEIDRIPVPITIITPQYPKALYDTDIKGDVRIEFYIDEQGNVRMPAIVQMADPELANSASDAIRQWKFEPPTQKNRPVMVKASQIFSFSKPKAKKVSSTP